MSSYIGRHAQLYDLFYAGKPYAEEAQFVHRCLQNYSNGPVVRLLELACGSGSHALELAKYDYHIVATDYSEDMLAMARKKAERASANVDFRAQDMTELSVAEGPFDAAICLFDSIGYVATNERIGRVLKGVHRHLRPDGLFIFEFWHAAAMLRNYDPVRVRRWDTERGTVLRISETSLDCAAQLSQVTYTIYELNRDGTYDSLVETQVNRYFLVQEMSYWLTSSGFVPVKWFAGFSDDETITEETWHVVAVARRGQ
ncbi:MAG: class I SAM-dependent methyltransferase [Acidobacteriota bacterium]